MSRPAANRTRRSGTIRCAIYTRKSSEEGLEQGFNSLQAQREACEAFIKSQRHEGWVTRAPPLYRPAMRGRARVPARGQYSGSAVRAHLKLTSASTTV